MVHEVAAWLRGEHHAGLQCAGRPQVAQTRLCRPARQTGQVAAHVMEVTAQQVAQTAWLERGGQIRLSRRGREGVVRFSCV